MGRHRSLLAPVYPRQPRVKEKPPGVAKRGRVEGAVRFIERQSGLPVTAELGSFEAPVVRALLECFAGERPIRLRNVQGRWFDGVDGEWVDASGRWVSGHDADSSDRRAT
jgi:hypothetical protein